MSTLEDVLHCTNERYKIYQKDYDTCIYILPIVIGYERILKNYKYFIESPNKPYFEYKCKKIPIEETLKTKHYIRIGDECCICYDPMYFKSNTVLTNCGHGFHYKCLLNYFYKNYNNYSICPLCRQKVGNIDGIKERYYFNFSNNYIDILDDFYNIIESKIPKKCIPFYKNIDGHLPLHDIGMNNRCFSCFNYRKNGYGFIK